MTYPPPLAAPPANDTPVDERPPYDEPRSWRMWLVVALLVAAACVVAYVVARLARRALRYLLFEAPAPPMGTSTMIFPEASPYAGPVYRIEFYDGTYPQLTDLDLSAGIDLTAPDAEARLASLGRQLAATVEARDGQRCFAPRLVLLDGAGRPVREWSAAA